MTSLQIEQNCSLFAERERGGGRKKRNQKVLARTKQHVEMVKCVPKNNDEMMMHYLDCPEYTPSSESKDGVHTTAANQRSGTAHTHTSMYFQIVFFLLVTTTYLMQKG